MRAAFQAIFRAIMREKIGPATVVAERRRDARDGRPSAIIVVADASDVQAVYDSSPVAFEEKRGGLGLALPIARRVIERYGGNVSTPADSQPAAIIIRLPVSGSTESLT